MLRHAHAVGLAPDGVPLFVLAWAELHQAELHENRNRARAGETLQEIEPLR
jgi:hypothetical protein